MMLPNDPLELSILLYKNLIDRKIFDSRTIEGNVPSTLDFDEVVEILEISGLLQNSNKEAHKIEYQAPVNFFISMDVLLSAPSRRAKHLERFYLASEDFLYYPTSTNIPDCLKYYIDATGLFSALKVAADHEQFYGSEIRLVFLQQHKMEILPKYNSCHLKKIKKLEEFKADFVNTLIHNQQKKTIVKTTIFELFSGKTVINLSEVISCFDDFYNRVNASYQLYVSEFSFQKVKSEIEKEKLEYTTKLNKVFSDIQNQLLAVPAALILVGGQMESAKEISIKNFLIWSGALVFSIFMNFLINNQKHTLVTIKREIDEQWSLISDKHQAVAGRFKNSYEQLDARYAHQKNLLKAIDFIIAAALGASTYMLTRYSSFSNNQINFFWVGGATGLVVCIAYYLYNKYCHHTSSS